jgi:multidrug efflux pump
MRLRWLGTGRFLVLRIFGSSSAGSNATTTRLPTRRLRTALTPPANALTSGVGANGGKQQLNGNTAHEFGPSQCRAAQRVHAFEKTTEPLSINHQGQFPAVTVSFNLAPNAALGGAITAIDKVQKD